MIENFMNNENDQYQINPAYIKKFHCESEIEMDWIKRRNLIKNNFLPKFEILSEKLNVINVSMMYYPNNGFEEIIKVILNENNSIRTHILRIFNACFLIENLFGKFELTENCIKADKYGNIFVWLSQDFEKCFPVLKENKSIKKEEYKNKFYKFLEKIEEKLSKKFINESSERDLFKLNEKMNEIKKFALLMDFEKECFEIKEEIEKYWSTLSKMKTNIPRVEKAFSIREFEPYRETSKHSEKSQQGNVKTESKKRFSYNNEGSEKKSNFRRFENLKYQFSTMENILKQDIFTNSVEIKPKLKKEVRIPKFIKEKQLSKSDEVSTQLKNRITKTDKKTKDVDFHRRIKTEKEITFFKSTELDFLQNELSFEIDETAENVEDEISLTKSIISHEIDKDIKNVTQYEKEFKSTRSTLKLLNRKESDNQFFVPKLSLKEEKQIEQDLFELFSSRCKISKDQDSNMEYHDEELAREILSILE